MSDIRIVAVEDDAEAERQAILQALIDYNIEQAGDSRYRELALVVKDVTGRTVGGLFAKSYYGWMFVELLALPAALRGRGLGTRLLTQAEDTARAQSLTGIWLDTFAFQARGFYEKLGYQLFGTIEDHPKGDARSFMKKRL